MSEIVVVGGGFAAVWSAAAAVRTRIEAGRSADEIAVTLVAPSADMVIRPRLYEENPASMTVPLDDVLGPIGVRRVQGTVSDIDPAGGLLSVTGMDAPSELAYDRLVLATGSRLVPRPPVPGAEHFHDVDTVLAADALERHLDQRAGSTSPGRFTAVVVGSGFVGLEVATELVERLGRRAEAAGAREEVRVLLVERADAVAPELGEGPRAAVLDALEVTGVELLLGTTVAALDERGVTLADGSRLDAETVVWSGGMRAQGPVDGFGADRDTLGRLVVTPQMFVAGLPDVLAAGDVASVTVAAGLLAPQSCQYAHQHGKHAGHNAVADLLGIPLLDFRGDPYVTCLDLGAAGAVYTEGYEREVRAVGEAAKDVKRMVNTELIYPPVKDAELILTAADHLSESRPMQPASGPRP
ncbi:MAG TPA: FAD-dependent oxidoreductase [Jiangellaceae bacterium]